MNYISSNYFEIFMLLWLRDVASLDNVCHHDDENCEEASPDRQVHDENKPRNCSR